MPGLIGRRPQRRGLSMMYEQSLRKNDLMLAEQIQNTINPLQEVIAYETLWAMEGMTETKMTELFKKNDALPSVVLGHSYQPLFLVTPRLMNSKIRSQNILQQSWDSSQSAFIETFNIQSL